MESGFHRALVEILVAVPGPVPAALNCAGAAEDRAVEVGGSGKSAIQAMPPDQIIGASPSVPPAAMTLPWAERADFSLDADGREILLDRLGDARLRIGVGGGEEHGLETRRDSRLRRAAPWPFSTS